VEEVRDVTTANARDILPRMAALIAGDAGAAGP
jgi:hypothetical protein